MSGDGKKSEYKDKDKPTQIRYSNITAAKGRHGRHRRRVAPMCRSIQSLSTISHR